jgi:hypothetical protein
MTPLRLFAIAAIYACAAIAWFVLGTTVSARSGEFDGRLAREVALLWGGKHQQRAPEVFYERPKTVTENVQQADASGKTSLQQVTRTVSEEVALALDSSQIDVSLALDHRRKGLLWYDTYGVTFRATYRTHNPTGQPRQVITRLAFPSDDVQFDNFVFRINGQPGEGADDLAKGATARVDVPPGGEVTIELGYDSRGLDTWTYTFGSGGVAHVQAFALTMRTDFDRIDFPAGTMSPSGSRRTDRGWELEWRFDSLLTGRHIGMDLPNRVNPGPMAARITYFAPVSLLFFLTVMVILGVLRSQNLHPMNYAFLSAAFFAFHLLLAYLVDHLSIHVSFAIAAAVSIVLVVTYLRLVAGSHFAIARAGLAQMIFLVLFSYAFFFEGFTGLTVTIGAVATLFVLMQATGRVDWNTAFARGAIREAERS